ncbi:MAG TPA: pantoate--beta-alanine ligase [Thermoanaerobaculia bacterium]|nr:pantoate--beta-alanine ligase [Thermoanaerobaculia bacterium]
MDTATTQAELRRRVDAWRQGGETVGFVPTMGALHEGHLALVRRCRELADRTVVSVFVNPTQFNEASDLERYPRTPERDAELLAGEGTDLLFLPPVDEIYPPGDATRVEVAGPAEGLEGAHRPGHFRGVATVVARLFHLVRPHLAVFGEKDAQQLAVVRRMTADLHIPVDVVGHPTVREEDGLAMSSRNALLSPGDRAAAPVLHRALVAARDRVAAGERSADALRRTMAEVLAAEPRVHAVEYAEVVDGESFQPLDRLPESGRVVLPIAVRVGGEGAGDGSATGNVTAMVRLIDNFQLDMSDFDETPSAAVGTRGADVP